MADWQRLVTEEVHGSDLPLVDPVASMGSIPAFSLLHVDLLIYLVSSLDLGKSPQLIT